MPRLLRLGLLLILCATVLDACSRGEQPASAAPAQPAVSGRGGGRGGRGGGGTAVVTTAPVIERAMPVQLKAVGNVEASSTVEIRSQVSGELLAVEFTEGQDVKAGDLLFRIDSRPLEVALSQADATLAKDTAQSKNAEAQRARYVNLLKSGLISQADYDTVATQASTLQAAIASDNAQIESVKLQLQYTKIAAPVSGRTGALLVHKGSIVRANDPSALVVINQIAPAQVTFAVPARMLTTIRTNLARGTMRVDAVVAGSQDKPSVGAVSFIDNAANQATDTIRIKGTFPNTDHRLWPGQFVEVTLQLSVETRAIVVPSTAVQPGQQGTFVYVVKQDQTVEARPVAVSRTDGPQTVIANGLRAGEQVVTDGQLGLTPGARVSVKPSTDGR